VPEPPDSRASTGLGRYARRMFPQIFGHSAADLAVKVAVGVLVVVPIIWAMLRNRTQTMNNQIDALARKSKARNAP
jgi:hypothetical protein